MNRVLVAGIGNIFCGDDGFGSAVAQRLLSEPMPPGVVVHDIGIRSVHLAYELLDGYDTLIIVDAMPRGAAPGALTLLEVTPEQLEPPGPLDPHDLGPAALLAHVSALGGRAGRTLVVGCEPGSVEEGIGLTPAVERAVEPAVALVNALLEQDEMEDA